MADMRFYKVHGAGNDFVVMDGRELPGRCLTPGQVAALCHRHFGVGADGVLLLHDVREGLPAMRIYNADGSVAEMCGNGLRCFAMALQDHFGFAENPLHVLTDAGEKRCRIDRGSGECRVSIDMGGVFAPGGERLLAAPVPEEEVVLGGETVRFRRASTGNPHAVLFGEFTRAEMERIGPALSTHSYFPEGTNVEFLTVRTPTELELTVCERGVGFTLACGTGAVASVGVSVATGRSPTGVPVTVRLPGGTLRVEVAADFRSTVLEGPAAEVFRGELILPEAS
jgi:diaminopimelate epimerase